MISLNLITKTVNWNYLFLMSNFFLGFFIQPAACHETWIEAESFYGKAGTKILADFMVGQNFKGDSLAYIPENIQFAGVMDGLGKIELKGFAGDYPAINISPRQAGLQILYYYTKPERITYENFSEFEEFVRDNALEHIILEHHERKLKNKNFTEAYSRCAKALLWRGSSPGHDVAVGMPLEIILEDGLREVNDKGPLRPLVVRLLWQGKPKPGLQIKVFNRSQMSLIKVKTNKFGRALIPITNTGLFMLNAVNIVPGEKSMNSDWHSYWASLTLMVK